MKKGISILLIGLVLLTLTASLTFAAGQREPAATQRYVLRFGHLANEQNSWHRAAVYFAEQVKQRSGGRIEVQVFPNEQLGTELQMLNAIQAGTADMTITGGSLVNWIPRIGVMETPATIRDQDHLMKVASGPIGQEIEKEIIEKGGFRPLAYFIRGPRNLTSNRPIRTPEDARGLIVRVPNSPLYVAFWEAVGATPTPMAFSEVFTSLQQGTIHAQENPLALIHSAGFHEVQRFVNVTEHLRTWIYVVIGEQKFQSMPADLQQIVLEAGKDMQRYEHELFLADEQRLADELRARGMTFVTDVDREAFTRAGQPGILRSLTPEQRALWDRIVAVR